MSDHPVTQKRGQFSSNSGFLFAAAGSAVGLGNIWGFPTQAASNGGAAFVLVYLVLAFFLAYPALMAELIIGRHARANVVSAMGSLSDKPWLQRSGKAVGFYGLCIASLILSFYAIVAGWMLGHLLEPVSTAFNLSSASHWLTQDSVSRNLVGCFIFSALTIFIVARGIEQGIEKWCTRLMPTLTIILALLIIYVCTQTGASEGLQLYLVPNVAELANPQLFLSAMGQAFFSLSLGVGTMLIYGSYLGNQHNLPRLGAAVTLIDTSIAFTAGLLIIPAMYVAQHNGVSIFSEQGDLLAGPGLIFQVLPALFHSMGAVGLVLAFAFFTLLTIAALTSSISMLEVPVSFFAEKYNSSRTRAALIIGSIIFAISTLIIFNFDALFGRIISLTTVYSEPLLGLCFCVFAGWVLQRNKLLSEIRHGYPAAEHSLFWKIWPNYVRFVCPLLILATLWQSLA